MNKGFIALTLTLSVAGTLLALIGAASIQSAVFFDMALKKEYRAINSFNALNCIDQAILELAHDNFFTTDAPISLPYFECSIVSVKKEGDLRLITTRGDLQKAYVYRSAVVRLNWNYIEVTKIE